MRTSSSNIRRLRSGVIGSISAWLPSRRSTAHQRGATVVVLSGQVRSGSGTGRKGAYLPIGIGDGRWGLRACGWLSVMVGSSGGLQTAPGCGQLAPGDARSPRRGADLGEGLAAADKQEAA